MPGISTQQGPADALEGVYLIFRMAQRQYGIPIRRVVEILKEIPVAAVPGAPGFIRGIIHLRGSILPIIDLRVKLDLRGSADHPDACIIVVRTENRGSNLLGILVDQVLETVCLAAGDLRPSFKPVHVSKDIAVLGAARRKGVARLLDIDSIITETDLTQFAA